MSAAAESNSRRLGITFQIRNKLKFLDERSWKRFSARRLELIDTLDLSSKKASEQEDQIRNVAEALRVEFKYSEEYFNDFDRLVRAAIQSVRRNRKRSYRSKRHSSSTSEAPHEPATEGSPSTVTPADINGSESPENVSKRQRKYQPYLHDVSPNSGASVSPTNELVHQTSTMNLSHDQHSVESNNSSSGDSHLGLGKGSHPYDSLNHSLDGPGAESEPSDFSSFQKKFISEISRLNSDSQEDVIDNYPRTRNFTTFDRSRGVIDSMINPRISNTGSGKATAALPMLPPISNFHSAQSSNPSSHPFPHIQPPVAGLASTTSSSSFFLGNNHAFPPKSSSATLLLLSFIERSKACSDSTSNQNTENLQILGKSVITSCIAYLFEKSFYKLNPTSIEYLREKVFQDSSLARIFRELDPSTVSKMTVSLNDETAVVSLFTLLGGCVKDFGFDALIFPLCEVLYQYVLKDYPLLSKNAIPFCRDIKNFSQEVEKHDSFHSKEKNVDNGDDYNGLSQLNSLAAIATDIQSLEKEKLKQETIHHGGSFEEPLKKRVTLKFLTSVLEFSYPASNSAVPRLIELIENGKAAFKLPMDNESLVFSLKDAKYSTPISTDMELEKVFKTRDVIELEMFVRRAKEIPINELTSTVLPTEPPRILYPPPFANRSSPLSSQRPSGPINPMIGIKFLSNSDDTPPPPPPPAPLLPNFQPLL